MIRHAAFIALLAGPVPADPVRIDADRLSVTVQTPDGPVEIMRAQDNEGVITGDFARTSRACPPFCVQPMSPAAGVTTIGELELLDMLADPEALVIDSRTREWFEGGTIPGAVHMPWDRITDQLGALGCTADFEGWDCTQAREVALFCNGPWCGQSPTAIRAMIGAGYAPEKISYYRGGMQLWRLLGFTLAEGG
ncbi:rhodanese-like domain-containing protein [Profundibacterium mesophilum]|uniref:Thiosulfate3-mercaptopyruvate sulfurtransferase n=1 Tax=Profundibacterium mesophilum KAUST100406-0324 TaxID=1037889 RepID=A0A921NU60_9RHOB|nr:rhodanese-like domain-containing protein [Profundibacterium mesophilum]KAF0675266.1 thiosulfate3-mercaptopyruvate sulfurtransferase [Profundibacterium mesophilum KAUST100406-0324]